MSLPKNVVIDGIVYKLPYIDLIPRPSDEEMQALEDSINENGILSAVVVTQNNEVLEGNSRLLIAEKLGLKTDQVPITVFSGPTDTAEMLAIALNAVRRSWTREVRLETVKRLFKKGWSQGRIGKAIAASKGQVHYDLVHLGLVEAPKPKPKEEPKQESAKPVSEKPKPDPEPEPDDATDDPIPSEPEPSPIDDDDDGPVPPDPEQKTKRSPAEMRQQYIDTGFKLVASMSRVLSHLNLFKAGAEALEEIKDLLDEANKGRL